VAYPLLARLKGLERGRLISAPYGGKLLADMGAEILKSEPPATGDPARQYRPFLHNAPHREHSGLFLDLNAHKQSVTHHLATPHRPEQPAGTGGPVLPSRGCMWMVTRQGIVTRETLPPAFARHPSERCLGRAGAVGKHAGRSRA
jgi:hypothetical protein